MFVDVADGDAHGFFSVFSVLLRRRQRPALAVFRGQRCSCLLFFLETPLHHLLNDKRGQCQQGKQRGHSKRRHALVFVVQNFPVQRDGRTPVRMHLASRATAPALWMCALEDGLHAGVHSDSGALRAEASDAAGFTVARCLALCWGNSWPLKTHRRLTTAVRRIAAPSAH